MGRFTLGITLPKARTARSFVSPDARKHTLSSDAPCATATKSAPIQIYIELGQVNISRSESKAWIRSFMFTGCVMITEDLWRTKICVSSSTLDAFSRASEWKAADGCANTFVAVLVLFVAYWIRHPTSFTDLIIEVSHFPRHTHTYTCVNIIPF